MDGMSGLSRLNETDFDLVVVGFFWDGVVTRNYPKNISPLVLERRVLSSIMKQYYFYDGLFVFQRNLLFYR